MRFGVRASLAIAFSVCGASGSQAQGLLDPATYGFQVQSGLRYWYSNGNHQLNLKDVAGSALVSRLSWNDITGHAAETFFRADHRTGFFIKGIMGAGSLTGGSLRDEDFPPFVAPYSSTDSAQRDGNLSYWSVDAGYTALKTRDMRLGGFAGYGQWSEQMRAFGCAQTAGNGGVCVPSIPDSVLGITESYKWNFGRLGVVGDFKLTDRLSITAEGAWVFGADLDGGDNHHLRPAALPRRTPIDGSSQGVQLEAVLNYAITDTFSLGVGARYWHISAAKGHTHFEVQPGGVAQVSTSESERYGVFVQGSYKLGAAPVRAASIKDALVAAAPHNWSGLYAGIHAGSVWGSENTTFTGDSAFVGAIAVGQVPTVQGVSVKGLAGGVQAGYNWHLGTLIAGVEGDISAASIAGAASTTSPVFGTNVTTERKIDALGSLRARLGFLVTPDMLIYATGGLAFGDTSLSTAVLGCGPACIPGKSSGWTAGWVAGAGYETAIAPRMTWRTEYLYYDLGERTATATYPGTVPASNYNAKSEFTAQTIRTGINIKF